MERRIELLRLEGEGEPKSTIINLLTKQFDCSRDAVYRDYRLRSEWQPQIEEMKNALLKILNRHEQLFRKTTMQYRQSGDDTRASLYALNLLRSINKDFFEFLYTLESIKPLPETLPKEVKRDVAEFLARFRDLWTPVKVQLGDVGKDNSSEPVHSEAAPPQDR